MLIIQRTRNRALVAGWGDRAGQRSPPDWQPRAIRRQPGLARGGACWLRVHASKHSESSWRSVDAVDRLRTLAGHRAAPCRATRNDPLVAGLRVLALDFLEPVNSAHFATTRWIAAPLPRKANGRNADILTLDAPAMRLHVFRLANWKAVLFGAAAAAFTTLAIRTATI